MQSKALRIILIFLAILLLLIHHEPILTFHISLFSMNMNRFASFIGIKKESPAMDEQNCRHRYSQSYENP